MRKIIALATAGLDWPPLLSPPSPATMTTMCRAALQWAARRCRFRISAAKVTGMGYSVREVEQR